MFKRNRIFTFLIKYKYLIIIAAIILVVIGFYFYKFYNGFSKDNGVWGTFGDYVGGILNPIISAFAFYLIAKTYELQKRELEATRNLLEVSTSAQNNQIKLAALTALFNSNLMRINILETEKIQLCNQFPKETRPSTLKTLTPDEEKTLNSYKYITSKITENREKHSTLIRLNEELENQIKQFL